MVKPPLRTKSIGFKVSEEEYAQLEIAAQASGRTLGEWCREVVLASGQETKPTGTGAEARVAELRRHRRRARTLLRVSHADHLQTA
jgi:hypothetical protein